MDLLQTVRKSGSRGGVEFSWDDVKSSAHRENYLGHSLKAPVGRWQKNRDLNWYARSEDADLTPEQREEKERLAREEERRGVKAAEAEAMARALGLPAPETVAGNANLEPVGTQRGELNGKRRRENEEMGNKRGSSRRDNAEGWPKWQRRRSRSRSPDAHGERRHRHRHRRHHDSRSRSRSKCRDKAWVRRREESSCSRSRSRERRKERSWRERRGGYDDARSRSRSPPRVQRQRSRTPDGRGKRRNDDFYQPRRDSRGYD